MNKKVLVCLLIAILIVGVGCTKEEGYKLTKKVVEGKGSIEVTPDKGSYNSDEKVIVKAIPAEGYQFVKWTNSLNGGDLEETIIMTKDMTIGAKFKEESAKLNVEKVGRGKVEITPSDYEYGEEITLTANPDTSSAEIWKFEGWSGDLSGTETPKDIKAEEGMSITAEFARYYNQVTEVSGEGSITLDPDKEQYQEGETVEITANPASGYAFKSWSGDVPGGQSSKEITVTDTAEADKIAIKANFKLQSDDDNNGGDDTQEPAEEFTITTEVTGEGNIELSPDKQKYEEGETVEVKANAASNFTFISWDGDLNGSENPVTITITKDMSIKVEFKDKPEEEFTITAEKEGIGKITLDPDKDLYSQGEEVTITAEGINGYDFCKWIGYEFKFINSTQASKTIIMNENIYIKALFEVPINFLDDNLESAIREEINKSSGAIYPSDFGDVKRLNLKSNGIEDLSGLGKANLSNLEHLSLANNQIRNISALSELDLSNLEVLGLGSNEITDITALSEANLNNLQKLFLRGNEDIKWKWVVDEFKSAGVEVYTNGCNIRDEEVNDDTLNDILMTVNRETSFTAAGSYDKNDYPYGVVMQVHGSGETYTIYLAEALGGISHLNSDLDAINSRYECLSPVE